MNDRSTNRPGDHRRPLPRRAGLGLLVIVGVLAAGCGEDSTGAGESASSSGSERGKALLAYASCMRDHGVPDFPDPKRVSGGWRLGLTQAMMESPAYEIAKEGACRSLEQAVAGTGTVSAQERERALRFAACMRSHGVRSFPDPTFENGSVRFGMAALGEGPDAGSPAVRQADEQCARFRPGGGGR
jgi:hypothetical protein